MTRQKSFKRLVRSRMEKTGESYTAARAVRDWIREEGERPWQIRDELASTMHENFGVFRREDQMRKQGEIVESLRERYERARLSTAQIGAKAPRRLSVARW